MRNGVHGQAKCELHSPPSHGGKVLLVSLSMTINRMSVSQRRARPRKYISYLLPVCPPSAVPYADTAAVLFCHSSQEDCHDILYFRLSSPHPDAAVGCWRTNSTMSCSGMRLMSTLFQYRFIAKMMSRASASAARIVHAFNLARMNSE